jgi:hypothetical protein
MGRNNVMATAKIKDLMDWGEVKRVVDEYVEATKHQQYYTVTVPRGEVSSVLRNTTDGICPDSLYYSKMREEYPLNGDFNVSGDFNGDFTVEWWSNPLVKISTRQIVDEITLESDIDFSELVSSWAAPTPPTLEQELVKARTNYFTDMQDHRDNPKFGLVQQMYIFKNGYDGEDPIETMLHPPSKTALDYWYKITSNTSSA